MNTNSPQDEREHALRNAMNIIDFSLLLAGKAIESGDGGRAMEVLGRARHACAQCRAQVGERGERLGGN